MPGRPRADGAVQRLVEALRAQDATAVVVTLHRRVQLVLDGAGANEASSARGADAAAIRLLALSVGCDDIEAATANGAPAVVLRQDRRVRAVIVADVRRDAVLRLWAVCDPAKLTTWG